MNTEIVKKPVVCAICGTTFMAHPKAGRAKYCPDCAPAAYLAMYRRSNERFLERAREATRQKHARMERIRAD